MHALTVYAGALGMHGYTIANHKQPVVEFGSGECRRVRDIVRTHFDDDSVAVDDWRACYFCAVYDVCMTKCSYVLKCNPTEALQVCGCVRGVGV